MPSGHALRGVVRRTLGARSSPAVPAQYVRSFCPSGVKPALPFAWSRKSGAATAPFSSTAGSKKDTTAVSQSLLSDIQALENLHSLLSAPDSPLSSRVQLALERFERCHAERRCIFVTGIGKSGMVARRLAATLASISVRSQWIHGSEWTHGDLGNLQPGDVVVLVSHSGNTAELQALPSLIAARKAETIAIVGQEDCAIASDCSLTLPVPANDSPCCPVPSRSIIVQEAICNAIVEHLLETLDSRADAFRDNHPGGAIGDGFSQA